MSPMRLADPETIQLEQWDEFSRLIEWFSDNLGQVAGADPAAARVSDNLEQVAGAEPDSTRRQTASLMLKALNAFANRVFDFFEAGFTAQGPSPDSKPLLRQRNMTPAYVYGLLAEQVSYDVDAILRAYTQRRLVSTPSGQQMAGRLMRLGVEEIDKLAYSILLAAREAELVAQPATVFTYFHKALRIRLLPYVRVAFIGVPYEAIRVPQGDTPISYPDGLLAVAHEVGHYVYRSSIEREGFTRNSVQIWRDAPDAGKRWFAPWEEEIAADVFGAIIAGPHIAADFQRLSLQKRRNLLGEDDGHHPPPVLRPYIYSDTLRLLWETVGGGGLQSVADLLDKQWERSLGEDLQRYTDIHLPGSTTIYSIAEARERLKNEVLKPLVASFARLIELLASDGGTNQKRLFQTLWGDSADWLAWGSPLAPNEQQAQNTKIAAAFAVAPAPPDLALDENEQIIMVSPSPGMVEIQVDSGLKLGKTSTKFEDRIAAIEALGKQNKQNGENKQSEESVWGEVLSFGGWIDQGPSGGVAHGPP